MITWLLGPSNYAEAYAKRGSTRGLGTMRTSNDLRGLLDGLYASGFTGGSPQTHIILLLSG